MNRNMPGDERRGGSRASVRRQRRRVRPALLVLEERRLLATFMVSSVADGTQNGTLRWAIAQANAASSASVITFSSMFDTPQTITLAQGRFSPLELTNTKFSEAIQGPMVKVTISGNGGVNNVLSIDPFVTGSISNLSITGGNDTNPISYGGGGLFIGYRAMATVTGCNFSNNSALTTGGSVLDLGNATLSGCNITSSSAPNGGGISIGSGGDLHMNNCTITGNRANSSGIIVIGRGGGLANGGLASLVNCDIGSNTTSDQGGGVYNKLSTPLNMTDCVISGNKSSSGGGGFYNEGTLNLAGCTISNNTASRGRGVFGAGGFNGVVNLTDCNVTGNQAGSNGGGLLNYGGAGTNLSDCTVSDNTSKGSGGGLFCRGRQATLTSCTFSNDISDNYYGGGVWDGAGTSTIMNCTFSGDSGYDGGGLYDNSAADLVNCTFNNDSASYEGGGLYDFDVATVAYCTFSQNTAQYGGGVYAYFGATLNMQNTIAAGNSASKKGPDIYYFYAVRSFGGNVIGNTDGSNGWTSADLTGTAVAPVNPLLAPLGNYGGPTETMALLPGSQAIGFAIPNSEIPNDQRGVPRSGLLTDSGAFESSGFTIAVSSGNNQKASVNMAFAAPLVVKVTSINSVEPVQGGFVGFLAPASGASCTFPGGNIFVQINGSGLASIPSTANGTVGSYTVTSTTFGDADGNRVDANFNLTNGSAAPDHLVIQTQPSPYATAGVAFGTQPVIYVEDESGNLDTTDNTTQVTVGLASGAGPLNGTTTITVSGGVATFTNLSDNRAETISLLFTSVPELLPATSNDVVVSPAAPSKLVIATQPSPVAMVGVPFSTQPVIDVEDQYGNLETGDDTTEVIAGLNSGSGPLAGTTTVTASGGVAAFTDLSDSTAETISLLFTSGPPLAPAISNNIVVSAGVPFRLAIATQPSSTATAGTPFLTQPVIDILDQNGNLETGDDTTEVTASLRVGAGPLLGTTTVTASGGVVTFSDLQDDRAEKIVLVFTASALSKAQSSPVTVSAAAASSLSIAAPATARIDVPFSITVTAFDPYGNLATGYGGTVHFASSDGKAWLPGNYTFTPNDGGVHTFGNGVTFETGGPQTVTVVDFANPSIFGSASVMASGAGGQAIVSGAALGAGRSFVTGSTQPSGTKALAAWSPRLQTGLGRGRTVLQADAVLDRVLGALNGTLRGLDWLD